MPRNRTKKTASEHRKFLLLGLWIAALVLFVASACYLRPKNLVPLRFKDRTIYMERVNKPEDLSKGLGGRSNMPKNHGMLFVYDNAGIHCHWMKDMRFALDMIWLDESKKVIKVQENIAPETYPQNFCPDSPAKYVIELNAGTVYELNRQKYSK